MLQLGVFTTRDLTPDGHEYTSTQQDPRGEEKVDECGHLTGGREYRMRTFQLPGRGEKLFMLAAECAKELGYRDSYLLFNKNKNLLKILANQQDKDRLISMDLLPAAFRTRAIAVVTARSIFRQFGSRVIHDGRRVRDDYWETKAIEQGFTENDPVIADRGAFSSGTSTPSRPATTISNNRIGANFSHNNNSNPVGGGGYTATPYSSYNYGQQQAPQPPPLLPQQVNMDNYPQTTNSNNPAALNNVNQPLLLGGVFIPGSGINGSIDYFHEPTSSNSTNFHHHSGAGRKGYSKASVYEAQQNTVQFNKYINEQRKQRVGMWDHFWTLRQQQRDHILENGVKELLGNFVGEEQEESAQYKQQYQQIQQSLIRPSKGALEGPPPPIYQMPDPPSVQRQQQQQQQPPPHTQQQQQQPPPAPPTQAQQYSQASPQQYAQYTQQLQKFVYQQQPQQQQQHWNMAQQSAPGGNTYY